ncbi:MAG TPA: hypothetical protein VMD98_05665 [Bryocella sp.]|nr:hypothetical protein [Bryocella sp.]
MNRALVCLLATAVLLPLPLPAGDNPSNAPEKMTPQTRLAVMRDLQSERVFVRTVFPRGERGLEIKNGKVTLSDQQVAKEAMEHGFAARPGDRVVITNVDVREKSILVEINGGGKKHEKWYQHVSFGAGGGMATPGGAPPALEATGSLVTIEFDKYVPEMTGNQVRALLAPVFDFKALTQAEAYQKTLPPKVQNAIKNHQVLVGMDRDMVVFAKGRPPQKIRDKDDKGVDYEEWIYGSPPQEVDFVRFIGQFVTRLEIMTVDGEKIVRTQKEVDLPSEETEVAQKKDEPQPANRPTLRRPGEDTDDQQNTQSMPNTPYPQPIPPGPPTGAPPN